GFVSGLGGRLQAVRCRGALEYADGAPGFVVIQPVEVVTGGDAGLAARAAVEVDLEGVLLAGFGCPQRDEIAVEGLVLDTEGGVRSVVVPHRKTLGRRQRLL